MAPRLRSRGTSEALLRLLVFVPSLTHGGREHPRMLERRLGCFGHDDLVQLARAVTDSGRMLLGAAGAERLVEGGFIDIQRLVRRVPDAADNKEIHD